MEEDGTPCYDVIEHDIDLDYWNIRQWRRLYYLLSKVNEKRLTTLEIRPKFYGVI